MSDGVERGTSERPSERSGAASGLHLRAVLPERGIDVELEVAAGETVALLGPNGAGKSSLLAVIAGLLRPAEGAVSLEGRSLEGVPPHRRGVALLAQDALLFPHLSVLENVAFAPRAAGVRRRAAHDAAHDRLRQVGVEQLAGRRPHQISGGQAQRVAIARALAAEPRLLLLDEPMAALDVAVTPALRQTLRTVLADRTALLVTHDVLDALLLADRVVVLEGGRIVESGPTRDVLARPRSPFAARLAGLDLLAGTWDGETLTTGDGLLVHGLADDTAAAGEPAVAMFRPGAVSVFAGAPGGSPRNALSVEVTDLEPLGDRVRVRGLGAGGVPLAADITPESTADLALAPGSQVTFVVKATEVAIYGTFKPQTPPRSPLKSPT